MKQHPLYGFAQIKHGACTADTGSTHDTGRDSTLSLGLTWEFGIPSLYANDRRGATLTTSTLPGRAATWARALE